MFEITTETSFSAAHFLRDYHGPCENLHGHNWLVRATVRCERLNQNGIGIDFKQLREMLRQACSGLDHKVLNDVLPDAGLNPSCENLARYIHGRLGEGLPAGGCRVHRVEVFETPGNSAAYTDD
jgi:6-pyruvoyltetrahydropterin/6-carboxytetrahydropterin synthase